MTPGDLKKTRLGLGLTQAQFAKLIGVSIRACQSWEQGWRPIPGWLSVMLGLDLTSRLDSVIR
jgi:DNA-binding transcriptional regulator YiaG